LGREGGTGLCGGRSGNGFWLRGTRTRIGGDGRHNDNASNEDYKNNEDGEDAFEDVFGTFVLGHLGLNMAEKLRNCKFSAILRDKCTEKIKLFGGRMDKWLINRKIWLSFFYVALVISVTGFLTLRYKIELFSVYWVISATIIWIAFIWGSLYQSRMMCKFEIRYENRITRVRFFVASFVFNFFFSFVFLTFLVGLGTYFGLTFGWRGMQWVF